ncbi:MAG: type II 3-dehydroquinate dehydratase [Candidatus Omnitrophica bacterium]|nr:type II 3-dehydroquinate dehydratase [Candidatus Omnitrophota bacterium]
MTKILVIHGPNLNLLGARETSVYGTVTLDEINRLLEKTAKEYSVELATFQSNHEGDIVDTIGRSVKDGFSAIVINPAAYTHTSVAIRDAISAVKLPTVEVHLSNIYAREEFRHQSMSAPACAGQVSGFGPYSYVLGLLAAIDIVNQ